MKSKSPSPQSIPELEASARHALRARHYKEAIATLKDLLKRERRREFEEMLAEAYLGRAREVAAKGMFQEASLLWETHAGFHPGRAPGGEYLGWLLRAGQGAKLGQALAAAAEDFLRSPAGQSLLEAVALLALGDDKLLKALPQDHPVARQRPLLLQAIAAYAARRDEEAEECLKQIASRSPYRNLRTLLKGLLALERDPAGARDLLGRVEAGSACRGLAEALTGVAGGAAPAPAIGRKLPAKQQAILDKLRGYGKAQLALLRDFQKAAEARSIQPMLETVLRHRGDLGEAASRRFCLAALPGHPDAIPWYERAYGKLPAFDKHRYKALHAEEQRDDYLACEHWQECLAVLEAAPPEAREPLTEALILRHVAALAAPHEPDLAIESLERSLALDPDDKPSYLQLIELHEREEDPKAGQTWLDRAIKQYPNDPDVLLLGMQAARRRKAFKKVAGYAKALLEVDPIHSQARRYLLEAHLGHARKQLKSGKLDAAEGEFTEARKLDPQRRNPALPFAEGLLAFLGADHERARTLWREAQALAGGGVAAWFQWAMEVQGVGLPLTGPGRLIEGPDKKHVPTKAELVALARLLGQYAGEGRQALSEALKKLMPMLKRGFKQADLGEDDFFGLCQGLANTGQYELLAECAAQGNRRCHYAPVFSYFEVLAKCRGDAGRLLPMDQFRLQMNLDQAHHAHDHRAIGLIGGFLRRHEEAQLPDFGKIFGGKGSPLDQMEEESAREFVERFEALDKLSPEERAMEIMQDMDPDEIRKLSPKEAMKLILGKLMDGLPDLPLPGGDGKPKKKR